MRFRIGGVLFLGIVIAANGCGSKNPGPQAYPSSGRLYVNGMPAVGAQISLHPASGENFDPRGCRPSGRVDENGEFALTTYEVGDGAPEGEYVATIYWAAAPDSNEPSPDRLGGKFLNPARSELKVHIEAGINQIPDIALSFEAEEVRSDREIVDDVDRLRRPIRLENKEK